MVIIAANRWKLKRLVDTVCVRMGYVEDGEPHYRGLSQAVGLSATTISNMLARGKTLPDWRTLRTLVEKTEVPMIEWLVALDVISMEDMAGALRLRQPPQVMSEGQRAALEFFDRWPDVEALRYLEWLRQNPHLPAPDTGPA